MHAEWQRLKILNDTKTKGEEKTSEMIHLRSIDQQKHRNDLPPCSHRFNKESMVSRDPHGLALEDDRTIAMTPDIIKQMATIVLQPISSPNKHLAKNRLETKEIEPIGVMTDCGVNVNPTKSPKLPQTKTAKPSTQNLFL